ncbi:MAG TPA: nucleotidyltransferase family protein [Solirubrobacteraceae bacterium]|jgi:hypothetical protein|nr:nucleotidyltransferase family protein [Solirubrobacteraceae bacterium]
MEATVRSLAVDRVSAEVVDALRVAGAEGLLLKGPVFAAWLYRDGAARAYVDTDILVSPRDFPVAQRALAGIGFSTHIDDTDTPGWRQVAHHWVRARDGANVDLHRTLVGVGVPDAELWDVVSADAEPFSVAGREVRTPGVPVRALHIALHAAQHGTRAGKHLDDLERALCMVDPAVWRSARGIADRLSATGAFATGLRLCEPGCRLADELGVFADGSVETTLLAGAPAAGALGWHYLASARGVRARSHIVARKLFPTRRFMRAWSPVARRGPVGLAAAYVARPVWVLGRVVPGFWAWWRARGE